MRPYVPNFKETGLEQALMSTTTAARVPFLPAHSATAREESRSVLVHGVLVVNQQGCSPRAASTLITVSIRWPAAAWTRLLLPSEPCTLVKSQMTWLSCTSTSGRLLYVVHA